jgi:hypothetical protein
MDSAQFQSIPDVCDIEVIAAPNAKVEHRLLFEVPHGATEERHYESLRRRLDPDLPVDLRDFFFVNTDVGSTEYARETARQIVNPDPHTMSLLSADVRAQIDRIPPRSILLIRCLIPRTFIDTNRIVDPDAPEGMTAAIPEYVRQPHDLALLGDLHRRYHEVTDAAYTQICGSGGWALTPHTYAPKSVAIEDIDEGIGKALRRAYEPDQYEKWTLRPEVDLITEGAVDERLASPRLIEDLTRVLAGEGINATQNATYRLHGATMGYRYSARYPGRVLCMEVRRDLLADPFDPFAEMKIGAEKVKRIARPIAAAYLEQVARDR